MCGICGYINLSKNKHDAVIINKMVDTLRHRGPDFQGSFVDLENQVFFGHSRLSIIDVSDNGRQPMSLGKLTIVLNGEVYNYREIKKDLLVKGHSFKSQSDTEVVLHAFQEWGADCVCRFIGMYAFAIYDSESQTVTLCRDRAGVKPLYYYFDHQAFIFGSELKAFHQNPLFHKEISYEALGLYMRYGYIPTPYSVFCNTYKLAQGSYMVFDIKKATYKINRYWELKPYYQKPKTVITYEEALEETERIMLSAFQYRMVSDVPVGVFLSAGYDSTCVAALLQKGMTDKLRTFTIGFDAGNNEAPRAKEIAAFLGTNHSEHYCNEEDALNIVKDLPYYYDEPFADSSAIPTTLVSKIARQQVTVALSADGGDEIFAGYDGYASYLKVYGMTHGIPKPLKPIVGHIAHYASFLGHSERNKKKSDILYQSLTSDKDTASALVTAFHTGNFSYSQGNVFTQNTSQLQTVYDEENEGMSVLSRMLYADYIQYMQDDVLVKVDRAAMSTSLEGRNPLLDHRIVEFAAQLPDEYKLYEGIKKRILKDIVYKYVPRDLMDKQKTGFSVPLSKWLTGSLKDYVGHYLSDALINKAQVFNLDYVRQARQKFDLHPNDFASIIWKILQLQMWIEKWIS